MLNMPLVDEVSINRIYSPLVVVNNSDEQLKSSSSFKLKLARNKSARSGSARSSRSNVSSIIFSQSADELSEQEDVEDYYPKTPNQNRDILAIINEKISKLDEVLQDFGELRLESRISNAKTVVSSTTGYKKALDKETGERQIKQFAGIYSIKSVFLDGKVEEPKDSHKEDQNSQKLASKPKLVELYQYPGYEKNECTPLPNDIKIKDVVNKALESIKLLKKQPKYSVFLNNVMHSKQNKDIVVDLFWWCFLEKYQKASSQSIQQLLFKRIAKNYVTIIMMQLDLVYRETFFKNYANLLAMTVYACFTTCFPESYVQFNHDFKEFLCETCYLFISGCKPLQRSWIKWNFKKLDPPQAIFAEENLTSRNHKKKKNQMITFQTPSVEPTYVRKMSKLSKISRFSGSKNFYESSALTMNTLQTKNSRVLSVISEAQRLKFQSAAAKRESHPAGVGAQFENYLFDLYGHSPLVDCFMYNQNLLKINTAETLVQHPLVVQLPPLNAPTYKDVIVDSLKTSKQIEKDYKKWSEKVKEENIRKELENNKKHRELKRKEELLLKDKNCVKFISDLIVAESRKDANSTSTGVDTTINRILKSFGDKKSKS